MKLQLSLLLLCPAIFVSAARVPAAAQAERPAAARRVPGVDVRKLEAIEGLVRDDMALKRLPGAVVLVGVGDRIVYQKAIGDRALVPAREPMTLDTIFDLASLTKVVATTTSVMLLIEQGRVRLTDRVSTFIPGFERYDKANITVRHLLTHVSGLRPDVDLAEPSTTARFSWRSRRCPPRRPAPASSTATSTSFSSATSSAE
jgi:CubicO group peptidase (beta-lactamase class C family)